MGPIQVLKFLNKVVLKKNLGYLKFFVQYSLLKMLYFISC